MHSLFFYEKLLDNMSYRNMKKLVVLALTLAFSSSMAFAMEEDAMDKMMKAPTPSVSVGGSGKIGIKNVDDGDDTTEDFQLVRAYKVTFDSTGTTGGGLMFGAGMSIRDDTTETNDGGPVVRGSYVFVGGADGSWKLQFGDNDPGIDLVGGFGVVGNIFYGGDDATIALSGSFGNTEYRITAADPGINVPVRTAGFNLPENFAARDAYDDARYRKNNWSIGVRHSFDKTSVGVGTDSEDGLAVGVGTELSGVSTFIFWSKSVFKDGIIYGEDPNGSADLKFSNDLTGLGVKASMSAGEGATFSVEYSTLKYTQIVTSTTSSGSGAAQGKQIKVDFTFDLGGGATFEAGIEKLDDEHISYPGGLANPSTTVPSKKTTLEAAIAFSF
ncbi:MAG: hypothetical protein OXH90_04120 [Paracoccaceae bacterium]|nr:hypothetical protein [Paracoccaceae bacterium]MDE2915882.1 hypothetical protein [Paracoccaceae bacterium]